MIKCCESGCMTKCRNGGGGFKIERNMFALINGMEDGFWEMKCCRFVKY